MAARTIHPFPARMAPEIALDVIPQKVGRRTLTVIDPMCGSGTVLSAAVSRGQRAIGIDIDPLAVLMSSVATAPIDTDALWLAAEEVYAVASVRDGTPPWCDVETAEFVNYWFGKPQKRDLVALTTAIDSVTDQDLRSALRVGMSRIIVTKAPYASLAADTSHSRPHRVLTSSDYNVLDGFMKSMRSLRRLLDARQVIGKASVIRGDSRVLAGIKPRIADIAVTSPPYLNALDYMRGHKFALVWFGYSIPALRQLRGTSIGAERAPDRRPSPRVDELVSFIESDVANRELLPIGTIQRYANDMVGFANATERVLKKTGQAVLVVGNSTLRGNYIRNDLIAQKAMEDAGLTLHARIERDIPATSRYLAINRKGKSQKSSLENRMRSEVVLTMAMSNG